MKKLLYIFLGLSLMFACSDDSGSDANAPDPDPVDETNPVYLDSNGVTIKAKDWAVVGDSGIIQGITYTVVDEAILRNMIFNEEDVTIIVTTKVTNMSSLMSNFADVSNFNQNIGGWDVSNVTNMNGMFNNATIFNQDISNWDVSNVTLKPVSKRKN